MTGSLQMESKMRNPYNSTISSNQATSLISELFQVTPCPLKSGMEERELWGKSEGQIKGCGNWAEKKPESFQASTQNFSRENSKSEKRPPNGWLTFQCILLFYECNTEPTKHFCCKSIGKKNKYVTKHVRIIVKKWVNGDKLIITVFICRIKMEVVFMLAFPLCPFTQIQIVWEWLCLEDFWSQIVGVSGRKAQDLKLLCGLLSKSLQVFYSLN